MVAALQEAGVGSEEAFGKMAQGLQLIQEGAAEALGVEGQAAEGAEQAEAAGAQSQPVPENQSHGAEPRV